jgi:hypothetical protein
MPKMVNKANGYVLVAIGLFGISGYELALRLFHPSFLANDFAHGLWLGVCIGLEIHGLLVIRRAKQSHVEAD